MPPKNRVPKKISDAKKFNDICANKHQGNANSIQADLYLEPKKKNLRKQVYDFFFWALTPSSCEQAAKALSKPVHSISGRISELKRAKLLVEVGVCQTEQGNTASLYTAAANLGEAI